MKDWPVKLSRHGYSVTVKVGDMVTLSDGSRRQVTDVDRHSLTLPIRLAGAGWYGFDGRRYGNGGAWPNNNPYIPDISIAMTLADNLPSG